MINQIKNVVFNADGAFTNSLYYTLEGKVRKKFGPHDSDDLNFETITCFD